jgi:hypothetical protein
MSPVTRGRLDSQPERQGLDAIAFSPTERIRLCVKSSRGYLPAPDALSNAFHPIPTYCQ